MTYQLLPAALAAAGTVLASTTAPDGPPASPSPTRPDKSAYTLWHPTPRALLRELSADRPDKTESAYTVDAGHFQVELDVVNFTGDGRVPGGPDTRTSITEIAPLNIKLGILNQLDLQLLPPAWHVEEVRDQPTGSVATTRGFTDWIARFKLNLWGNDGGRTALAVLPFVKAPTATGDVGNGAWETGVKLPFALEVPGWEVGAMTEVDWLRNDRGDGHHLQFVNSLSVGRPIVGRLSGYVEFYSAVPTESDADWIGSVDTWVTFRVNEGLRLDAGVYLGVTRAAEDWHPFLGLTWRY